MTLQPPPATLIAPDGSAQFGAYAGPLPPLGFEHLREPQARNRLWRLAHRKRWTYVVLTDPRFVLSTAIVHLGYAANAFVAVLERQTRALLVDQAFYSAPPFCQVSDGCEEGCRAEFRSLGAHFRLQRPVGCSHYTLAIDTAALSLRVEMETQGAPSPLSVLSPVAGGLVNSTEKRALMPVRGQLRVGARGERLDLAQAGLDYTQGFLARQTSWRWAFAMGRSTAGQKLAFNLVQGFNEEKECALWLEGHLYALSAAHFDFAPARPLSPWLISAADQSLQLRFTPDAAHCQNSNLGLIRSRFVQPVGTFSGTLRPAGGAPVQFDSIPGVVETQEVLW